MTLRVVEPGMLALVQDQGRPGLGHVGVSASGAFDKSAFRQVNVLLGNVADAAVIEVLGGGLVVDFDDSHLVAVCGAAGALTLDDAPLPYGRAVRVRAGQRLRIHRPTVGLRTYLGVGGGLAPADELGSRSADTLSGIGPSPLRTGDVLAVGAPGTPPALDDVLPLGRSGEARLEVVLGPRHDWFTSAAVRLLLESAWQVSPASNRIGVRLTGPPLERSRVEELPSEPCMCGSIQVTTDGQPIVFGPDHPVTGGYPVIAVVTTTGIDQLAQVMPGQNVRFSPVREP